MHFTEMFSEVAPPSVAERTGSIHTMQAERQIGGLPDMSKQEKLLTSINLRVC